MRISSVWPRLCCVKVGSKQAFRPRLSCSRGQAPLSRTVPVIQKTTPWLCSPHSYTGSASCLLALLGATLNPREGHGSSLNDPPRAAGDAAADIQPGWARLSSPPHLNISGHLDRLCAQLRTGAKRGGPVRRSDVNARRPSRCSVSPSHCACAVSGPCRVGRSGGRGLAGSADVAGSGPGNAASGGAAGPRTGSEAGNSARRGGQRR